MSALTDEQMDEFCKDLRKVVFKFINKDYTTKTVCNRTFADVYEMGFMRGVVETLRFMKKETK